MTIDTILILAGLALFAALALFAVWQQARRQNADLELLHWLSILAGELLDALPAMMDEAAARAWLLDQIEAFAQAHRLEQMFEIFDPAWLIDRLIDLLAGRYQWRQSGSADGAVRTMAGGSVWMKMLSLNRRVR